MDLKEFLLCSVVGALSGDKDTCSSPQEKFTQHQLFPFFLLPSLPSPPLPCLLSFMCVCDVCACTFSRVCTCADTHAYVCECMWRPEVDVRYLSQLIALLLLIVGVVSHLNPESLLQWVVSQLPPWILCLCLYFSRPGVAGGMPCQLNSYLCGF